MAIHWVVSSMTDLMGVTARCTEGSRGKPEMHCRRFETSVRATEIIVLPQALPKWYYNLNREFR
jgi:hypothetical protein